MREVEERKIGKKASHQATLVDNEEECHVAEDEAEADSAADKRPR